MEMGEIARGPPCFEPEIAFDIRCVIWIKSLIGPLLMNVDMPPHSKSLKLVAENSFQER